MLRIGLRAHLTGFLVTGSLGFVTLFTVMAGFAASAGHTTAERAAFGHQM